MTATGTRAFTHFYRSLGLAIMVAGFAPNARSAEFDWPQWQGPDRTAHSKETG